MPSDILQFILYAALLTLLAWPLGLYMARLFSNERTLLTPLLGPLERGLYKACGVDATGPGQHWTRYALAALAFNLAGWVILYVVLRLQHLLPWNPQGMAPLSPDLAFNTAVSFVTNTNWQAYGGETTLSYFSQMAGLTVQNFVSVGTGIAIGAAVIRGFFGRETRAIGTAIGGFGVASAIFLILYVTFLGTQEPFYEVMRRFGVYLYFLFSVIAQIMLAVKVLRMPAGVCSPFLIRITRIQLALSLIPFALGILNMVLKSILEDSNPSENVIEWIFALMMHSYFVLSYLSWRDTQFSAEFSVRR